DLVIWSDNPLSVYAKAEKTIGSFQLALFFIGPNSCVFN
ncbi:MAG: hypothetical protein FYV88_4220, partial [Bacteroidetes bacterium]|nr:hypothetical protein [Bacteroidota bacterium]